MKNTHGSQSSFIDRFGAVYEHSPWVARDSWPTGVDEQDASALATVFAQTVDAASQDTKLKLIRSHPDLAGRAAVQGELTEDSNEEQSSAGIDQCNPEEFARFQCLNAAYKARFDFPFIMAVRNSNRHEILAAFEQRLNNTYTDEFKTAMREIHKIARLRLEAML